MDKLKHALVIGGTSGYGAGITEQLINAGYEVHVAGRNTPVSMDVRNADSVKEYFEHAMNLMIWYDVIVFCAGIAIGKAPVHQKKPQEMRDVIETNTIGLLNVLNFVYGQLLITQGHFIYLGSIASQLNYVGGADYCASKSASLSIMRTIRKEWLGTGIRTITIEPGLGDTEFQKRRYNGDNDLASKHTEGVRLITPEDMGNIVIYALSLPEHLSMDEIVIKPLDQASHGITVINKKSQF